MTLSEIEFVSRTRNTATRCDAFCEHTMQQNATAAGGACCAVPRAGFKGRRKGKAREGGGRGREGKGREWQRGRGREGRLTLTRSWNRAADWLGPP